MAKAAFAIGAHPDDVEFFMAGTLILLRDAGYEIHCMTIGNGSCGAADHDAEGMIPIRQAEARRAAESVGAAFHPSLVNDLEIFYEKSTLTRLTSIVREVAPEIVLTHSPIDYMEDHETACRLAVTAAFARGAANFPVDPPRTPLHQDIAVYHAQPYENRDHFSELVVPHIYVDITKVIDEKTSMLAEYKTQLDGVADANGMDAFLANMREMSRDVGRMSGKYEYAEGWRRRNPSGFGPRNANPLVDALRESAFVVTQE